MTWNDHIGITYSCVTRAYTILLSFESQINSRVSVRNVVETLE